MFDRVFGMYLVDKGKITSMDLAELLTDKNHARVKLGVLAVSQKMMTSVQADEINHLQSETDRRFGDLAIEKGYLNKEQVDGLLKLQGNGFLHFVQAIIDKELYTLDDIDGFMMEYQEAFGFSDDDMDDLVSGDLLREVSAFMPAGERLGTQLCALAVRSFLRLVDSEAYIEKAYMTDDLHGECFACQGMNGDHAALVGFTGYEDSLLCLANPFAREEFEKVDMDALDSVAEFINCVDGMFATALSENGVEMDMLPPDFYENSVNVKGEKFIVLPFISKGKKLKLVVALDKDVNVAVERR